MCGLSIISVSGEKRYKLWGGDHEKIQHITCSALYEAES